MITLVNVSRLIQLLISSNYDQGEIEFLQNGFKNGFGIGYEGPEQRQSLAENIPFTVQDRVDLWNKLMKEVHLKRVAGPFNDIPFENFIQSPIGLVPKSSSNQT